MDCPKCGGGVRVKESRAFPDSVIRRRVCLACGHSFCTEERGTEGAGKLMSHWHSMERWKKG